MLQPVLTKRAFTRDVTDTDEKALHDGLPESLEALVDLCVGKQLGYEWFEKKKKRKRLLGTANVYQREKENLVKNILREKVKPKGMKLFLVNLKMIVNYLEPEKRSFMNKDRPLRSWSLQRASSDRRTTKTLFRKQVSQSVLFISTLKRTESDEMRSRRDVSSSRR